MTKEFIVFVFLFILFDSTDVLAWRLWGKKEDILIQKKGDSNKQTKTSTPQLLGPIPQPEPPETCDMLGKGWKSLPKLRISNELTGPLPILALYSVTKLSKYYLTCGDLTPNGSITIYWALNGSIKAQHNFNANSNGNAVVHSETVGQIPVGTYCVWVRDNSTGLESGKISLNITPLCHPVGIEYLVSQKFGEDPETYKRWNYAGHMGLDFKCPEGTPVYACDNGEVYEVNNDANNPNGCYVRIRHDWGTSFYGHLSKIVVKQGDRALRYCLIGFSGKTGFVKGKTGAHLHFGITMNGISNQGYTNREGKDYVDPSPFVE